MDGKSYSDLEPILAPVWRATVVQSEDPRCSLSDYLFEFLSVCFIISTNSSFLMLVFS